MAHAMFDIVIPTKDRVEDLLSAVHSLSACTNFTHLVRSITIIDQSSTPIAQKCFSKKEKVTIIPFPVASLTLARNKGIAVTKAPFVLFCDDDILVTTDFLVQYAQLIQKNPYAYVYAPFTAALEPPHIPGIVKRVEALVRALFLQVSPFTSYSVLRNGRNTGLVFGDTKRLHHAQWVGGACMAIRREVFSKVRFEPQFTKYCFAEDVLFSNEVHRYFGEKALLVATYFSYVHKKTPIARLKEQALVEMQYRNRAYVLQKLNLDSSLTRSMLYYSFVGDMVIGIFAAFFKVHSFRLSWYYLTYFVKTILNKAFWEDPLHAPL